MYGFKNYRNCRGGKGLRDHLAQVLGYGLRNRQGSRRGSRFGSGIRNWPVLIPLIKATWLYSKCPHCCWSSRSECTGILYFICLSVAIPKAHEVLLHKTNLVIPNQTFWLMDQLEACGSPIKKMEQGPAEWHGG